MCDARGGDEPVGQQPVELRADVCDRVGLRSGRGVGQPKPDLLRRVEHLGDASDDVQRRLGQRTCHAFAQRRELHPPPRGRRRQHVHRGVGTILEQSGKCAVGIRAERQSGARIKRSLNGFHW